MKRVRSESVSVELTSEQRREIEALRAMPDSEIDTSDIPELTAEFWKNAVVGKFYRPVKKPVTMRLDADVIEWLKSGGRGYQTKANRLLRESMLAEFRESHASPREKQRVFRKQKSKVRITAK